MCVCLCVCVYTDAEKKCHTTHCNTLQYTATHIHATTFDPMSKTFCGLHRLASCILEVFIEKKKHMAQLDHAETFDCVCACA